MKVKWLGHASFLITAEDGTRIITDPYATGSGIDYDPINETADIVTISHQHPDHNNLGAVKGNPETVTASKTVKGIDFRGIATYHDAASGRERGANTVFCFTVDGIRLCHLGDLGHPLSDKQVADIGGVDVLFIPVGGYFTIDAATATRVADRLKPKVIIPMHYKTARCGYPIGGVEEFLRGKGSVRRAGAAEVELRKEQLPTVTEVVVLEHAC